MSVWSLSTPCPNLACGDATGPYFVQWCDPATGEEAKDGPWGFSCGCCGVAWPARDQDKRDHKDVYFRPKLQSVDSPNWRPDPDFEIETRHSNLTGGFVHWARLLYKGHVFEEMLPEHFFGLDETGQALALAPVQARLGAQLRPILEAEDEPVAKSAEADRIAEGEGS